MSVLTVRLRHHLPGHDAFTTTFMGWAGTKNGALLGLAASEQFHALITTDAAIEDQQNLATLPVSVVILHARSNGLRDLLPLVPNCSKNSRHLSRARSFMCGRDGR
jgi:hypothetical protein